VDSSRPGPRAVTAPEPQRQDGPGRALVAVGVFAAITMVVLIAALLWFAARHR
jgi:hypothetical protein